MSIGSKVKLLLTTDMPRERYGTRVDMPRVLHTLLALGLTHAALLQPDTLHIWGFLLKKRPSKNGISADFFKYTAKLLVCVKRPSASLPSTHLQCVPKSKLRESYSVITVPIDFLKADP